MNPQKDVLALGQIIIDQLDKQAGREILSAWMSHHIAELLDLAKTTKKLKVKQEAENRAFSAILSIWEKRRFVPGEIDPLKKYQSDIDIIESYGKENEQFWKKKQLNEPSQITYELLNNTQKIIFGMLIVDELNTEPLSEELTNIISQFLEPEKILF